MRKRKLLTDDAFKLNIQFFAEEDSNDDVIVTNPTTAAEADTTTVETPKAESSKNDDADPIEDDKQTETVTVAEMQRRLQSQRASLTKQFEEDKANSINEALKLRNMNKEEREQHQRDKDAEELQRLKQENLLFAMEKEATKMLADSDIAADDRILSIVVADSAEKTKANIEAFRSVVDGIVQQKLKDAVSTPTPKNQPTKSSITAEEIENIADDNERQRMMLQHFHLFQQ